MSAEMGDLDRGHARSFLRCQYIRHVLVAGEPNGASVFQDCR
jgi:hypothetical protein